MRRGSPASSFMNAVDTNVLIYANDPRDSRKYAIAIRLVEDLDDGVLPWQVICEFLAASRKLEPFGFSLTKAWRYLEKLRSTWQTVLPRWEVQVHAYELTQRYSISYWDALLLSACSGARIERLYSEDLENHDGIDGLEIVNPFRNP
jgi:predicted nucleic acid-binding protein